MGDDEGIGTGDILDDTVGRNRRFRVGTGWLDRGCEPECFGAAPAPIPAERLHPAESAFFPARLARRRRRPPPLPGHRIRSLDHLHRRQHWRCAAVLRAQRLVVAPVAQA